MRILVIFTGGTIGSTESNGYVGLQESSIYRLLSLYRAYQDASGMEREDIVFDTMEPYTILSENSTGEILQKLADSVRRGLYQAEREGYAGIIVTHGTDTLAWSAALLGFLFADSRIPVVMVSSNYILADPRANGLSNFIYAVEFIRQWSGGGVYVSYRNTGDVLRIHLATRLLGHQAYSDAVESIGSTAWFGEDGRLHSEDGWPYQGGGRLHSEDGWPYGEDEAHTWSGEIGKQKRDRFRIWPECMTLPSWDAPILQIYPSPGMRYPQIPAGTRAILHHTYHAGTIGSDTPGIASFFTEAGKRQIPVFLTGADVTPADGIGGMARLYESTRIFEEYAIRVLPMASPIAMYIKLWLLLGSGLDPMEWMEKNIAGEIRN